MTAESVRLLSLKLGMHPLDDVAYRADRLELGDLNLLTGIILKLHHEIDGVDAVQVEILEEPRLERDLAVRHLESVAKIARELGENLVARRRHGCALCARTK